MTFAEALAKSSDMPICGDCAKREGATQYARQMIQLSLRTCAICEETTSCTSIRDWIWPKAKWRLPLETKA